MTAAQAFPIVVKALELCNESRNRLTQFQSSVDFWLSEAHAELEKAAPTVSEPGSGEQSK